MLFLYYSAADMHDVPNQMEKRPVWEMSSGGDFAVPAAGHW